MLVLSRKKGESIVIDGHIIVTVVEVRGDKVRLGIQAPKEIPIHRSEIYEVIQIQKSSQEEEVVVEVTAEATDEAESAAPGEEN